MHKMSCKCKIKCIIISTIQNLYDMIFCYSDHIIGMKVVSMIFLIIIINMSQFKLFFFSHNGFVAVVGNDRIRVLICMQCYWRCFFFAIWFCSINCDSCYYIQLKSGIGGGEGISNRTKNFSEIKISFKYLKCYITKSLIYFKNFPFQF